MRDKPFIKNFLAGEIAPQLDGLVDAPIQGCRTLENFIVRKHGGLQRRPGTFWAGEVKTSSLYTRIIPFESTTGVHYIIELGNIYARFWKQSTHAVMGGVGSETEVVTPYLTAELRAIKYVVIKDSIYFTHQNHPVQKLTWTSDTSWVWEDAPITVASKIIMLTLQLSGWQSYIDEVDKDWEMIDTFDFDLSNYGQYNAIIWGNNIWVAVGEYYRLSMSYDGKLWVPIDVGDEHFHGLIYGGSLFMALCANGVCISQDAISWSKKTFTGYIMYAGAYCPKKNRYVIGGQDISAYYSDNSGTTWTTTADTQMSGFAMIAHGGAYGNDVFVLAGAYGQISHSADYGVTWSLSTLVLSAASLWDAIWIEEESVFLICGSHGQVAKSADGDIWSLIDVGIDSAAATILYGVLWDGNKAYLCGSSGYFMTSPDLSTWTTETVAEDYNATFKTLAIDKHKDYPKEEFNEANHYPRACTAHEGRLLLGGSIEDTNRIWGSMTNHNMIFNLGAFDDDAWDIVLGGRKQSRVLWMEGASKLVIGTDSREGVIEGGPSGITASVRGVKWQSTYGSDDTLQGMLVNDVVIFAQRNATIVRALQYKQEQQTPVDLTYYADHITTGGIKEWDYQNSPESILWATRDDGTLLSMSFEPALQILAWARHTSGVADFESVAVVGGSTEDEIWLVVERTVNASTVRYLEYMDVRDFGLKADAHSVDCGLEVTMSGTAVGDLTHIAAETVDVLINGNIVESHVVTSLGAVALTHECNAEVVHVGLPFDSTMQTTRLRTGSPWGEGVGLMKMIPKIWAWIYETIGGKFGPEETVTESRTYTSATDLETDMVEIQLPPKYNDDGYIWVIQDDPLPMTLLAISPEVQIGDK